MTNKFDFYEVVMINPVSGFLDMSDLDTRQLDFQKLIGLKGVILGMADENNKWFYDVTILDSDDSYMFREEDLQSTGEKKERADFYSDESVKVAVDPKSGEGTLVEQDDE